MFLDLKKEYEFRYENYLVRLSSDLQSHMEQCLEGMRRIDGIRVRAKSIEKFLAKAQKVNSEGALKYSDPLNQIQDQIGARIICHYLSDVSLVATKVEEFFKHIEQRRIVPDSIKAFGYEGVHFILFLPEDIIDSSYPVDRIPRFFELQIKTLFQHAWGESVHDLEYKPDRELSPDETRKIAFTAAQAWGADTIFDELHRNT